MLSPRARFGPLALAVTLYLALTALFAWQGMATSQGHFTYALDDAYIHLAMVKHQLQDGVWGLTPYEWSSSSSSPLWGAMLIALGALTGRIELGPLCLNGVASIALLVMLDHAARHVGAASVRIRLLLLLLFTVAAALPYVTLLGMEHLWQSLLALLFVHLVLRHTLHQNRPWQSAALLVLASLVTSIRFEGMLLVGLAALLLAWRQRWGLALGVVLLGALPVVLYATVSLGHGWEALPNSVLLKRSQVSLTHLPQTIRNAWLVGTLMGPDWRYWVAGVAFIAYFTVLLVALLNRHRPLLSHGQLALLFVGLLAVGHGVLARGGLRYELYLLTLFTYAVGVQPWLMKRSTERQHWLSLAPLALAICLLVARGAQTLTETSRSMTDIYNQQRQMGRFLQRYYQGASVAANDVGYINYAADIRCLDIVGLGSRDTGELILSRKVSEAGFRAISDARAVRIAIIYDNWFIKQRGGREVSLIPTTWQRVAKWSLPQSTILGGRVVSFYATSDAEAASLAAHLREFEPQLPPIVTVTYEPPP